MLIRITEAVRAKALRRPLVPAVYHDTDIKRFTLVVTTERAFWAQAYQLRGVNPRTGKRYGGGTRYEIGDGVDMPLAYARAAALKVKAAVREGRDPHGERMAKRKSWPASAQLFQRL
jgi:Arm domain-containing DNA-binding protein